MTLQQHKVQSHFQLTFPVPNLKSTQMISDPDFPEKFCRHFFCKKAFCMIDWSIQMQNYMKAQEILFYQNAQISKTTLCCPLPLFSSLFDCCYLYQKIVLFLQYKKLDDVARSNFMVIFKPHISLCSRNFQNVKLRLHDV